MDTDDARPAFDAEARSRRPVRCGTSRARPRPIRTTRRRRVARRAPRRTSAAHRPSRASSRKTTIRRETLTSLVVRSSQAAVVGAATVLMASPAFAATIKLGGDNGELGFFVSDPSRRSRFRRARVRPSAIAAASQSPMPTRADPRLRCDTSASGRRASSRASRDFLRKQKTETHLFHPLFFSRSPTRSPSPRVRPSSS